MLCVAKRGGGIGRRLLQKVMQLTLSLCKVTITEGVTAVKSLPPSYGTQPSVKHMREIKFRAWDKEENIMLNVVRLDFMRYVDGRENKNCEGYFGDNQRRWFDRNNVELMQYTGLLDKNDKEIYEGDIVKVDGFQPENYEVVFNRGGFCLKFGEESNFYPDIKYAEKSEIIGNIYENPDLLT